MKKIELKKLIRECLKEAIFKSVKDKPSYGDQIRMAYNKAKKEKNAEAMAYYQLLGNTSANVPFERFKNSWAYGEWIKKPEVINKIKEIQAELKRFSYLNEAQRRVSYFGLKHGELEQYALRKLQNEDELPQRIDYYPHYTPKTTIKFRSRNDNPIPDRIHEKQIEKLALDDLETIKVDGIPLTQLYDWKIQSSNVNPHGWGDPQWRYDVVGSRKV